MKKYLTQIKLSALATILLFTVNTGNVYAYSAIKQDFYNNIVKSWEYNLDNQKNIDEQIRENEISQKQKIEIANEEKQIASGQNNELKKPVDDQIPTTINNTKETDQGLSTQTNVYNVYAKPNITFTFYADKAQADLAEAKLIELGFTDNLTNEQAHIYQIIDINQNPIYIIDQSLVLQYETSKELSTYFKSLAKTFDTNQKTQIQNTIDIQVNEVLKENLLYALIGAFFALLTFKIGIFIKNDKKRPNQKLLYIMQMMIDTTYQALHKLQGVFTIIAIGGVFAFAYGLAFLSYYKTGQFDYAFVADIFNQFISPTHLIDIFKNRHLSLIGLSIYFYILSYIIFLTLLPNIILFSKTILQICNNKKLNDAFYKWSLLTPIILILITIAFQPKIDYFALSGYISLFIILSTFLYLKSSCTIQYTLKQKLALTIVLILTIGGTILLKSRFNQEQLTTRVKLFDSGSKVVFLPWYKDLSALKPTFYQAKKIKPTYPIFINDILVFYPNANQIINKSITNQNTDFIYYPEFSEKVIGRLLKNQEYRELYITDETTNTFYYQNSESNRQTQPKVTITYNCDMDLIAPKELKYTTYFLDNKKVKKESQTLGYFDGCEPDQKNKKLEYPINYSFEGQDGQSIINFGDLNTINASVVLLEPTNVFSKILSNNEPRFIQKQSAQQNSNQQTILNLSVDKDVTSHLQIDENGMIDISNVANDLYEKDYITDKIKIWTQNSNTIIIDNR